MKVNDLQKLLGIKSKKLKKLKRLGIIPIPKPVNQLTSNKTIH
jgi:hypothetical protein